jgi:hypothetical protein
MVSSFQRRENRLRRWLSTRKALVQRSRTSIATMIEESSFISCKCSYCHLQITKHKCFHILHGVLGLKSSVYGGFRMLWVIFKKLNKLPCRNAFWKCSGQNERMDLYRFWPETSRGFSLNIIIGHNWQHREMRWQKEFNNNYAAKSVWFQSFGPWMEYTVRGMCQKALHKISHSLVIMSWPV